MSKRILRINSEIEKTINEILAYEIKNPRITGIITVTKCETTMDLDICKVYVSIFSPDDNQMIFDEIKHSAGFIRQELCRKMLLRKVPYLEFYMDNSQEYTDRIEKAIDQINKERNDNV
jgi:ribosome-binding factor A